MVFINKVQMPSLGRFVLLHGARLNGLRRLPVAVHFFDVTLSPVKSVG